MSDTDPHLRNDRSVQDAAKAMFIGIAPERAAELEAMWRESDLRFNVLADDGRDGKFVMDAGCYRDIRFNHRVMRAFWVASFAAWEGYRVCAESTNDLSRFKELVECVQNIVDAPYPEQVPLPDGVPTPGVMDNLPTATKAAADLAVFAVGWAFLHEVQHIRHQRHGTQPSDKHNDELSCDAFATTFLLALAERYASDKGIAVNDVLMKRQAGVHVALFAMTLMTDGWGASESHPSIEMRIAQAWALMKPLNPAAAAIAVGAAHSLAQIWANTPPLPTHLLKAEVFWVFGYGSLMWDGWEAAFGCLGRQSSVATGYKRSFCKPSVRNWGTKDAPCPTLNLVPDESGTCTGIAFAFPTARRDAVQAYLKEREGKGFDFRKVDLLVGGQPTDATAAIYPGLRATKVDPASLAAAVRAASGASGTCVQYVSSLHKHLVELGVDDPAVTQLVQALNTASSLQIRQP